MSNAGSGKVTGLRTVAVPVTDQDRAVAFYSDVLGLEVRMDAPVEQIGGRWIELAAAGSDTSIALIPAGEPEPTGVVTGIRLSVDDAVSFHSTLGAAGVEVDELLRWPGIPPMFEFRDPDGNTLVVVE